MKWRAALLIYICFFCANVYAEVPPDYLLSQYKRAAERTIATVLQDIRPTLSRQEQKLLDDIEILVDNEKATWDVYGVHASRKGNERRIVFTLGFIIAVDQIDQAVAVNHLAGRQPNEVIYFIRDYVEAIRENIRRKRRGEQTQDFPAFSQHAGYTEEKYNKIIGDPNFKVAHNQIKLDSFALILGHELGHHFLGHLDNSSSSLEEELEADTEGARISMESGHNPIGGWTPFLLFAALENDTGIYNGSDTHPPPICRATEMIQIGAEELENDPGFINFMEQSGQLDKWRASISELESFALTETECP